MKLTEKFSSKYANETEKKVAIAEDEKSQEIIKELKSTGFGGDNESQMKAVQLLKGLATSDSPDANAFMKKLDSAVKGMSEENLTESEFEATEAYQKKSPEEQKKSKIAYWKKVIASTEQSIKSAEDRAKGTGDADDRKHYLNVAKEYKDSLGRARESLKQAMKA
jgi:hypothetical protein